MCNSGVSYGGACIVVTGEPTNPSRAARLEALNSLDSILTVKGRLAAISSSCKRQGNGPLGGIFATNREAIRSSGVDLLRGGILNIIKGCRVMLRRPHAYTR
jgi:hypothetical protein